MYGTQVYSRYPVPKDGDYSNYPPAATIRHEVYEFSGQDALVAQFDHWENVGGYYVQAGGFNHFRTFDLDVKTAADRLDEMMVQRGYRLLGGPFRLSDM
jgi:hypothetical protein